MPGNNFANVAQRTNVYAATVFLEHAEPQEVFSKFGDTKPMPKNKAETIKWRRSVPFPRLTVELAEGVTPTARQMQFEDVSATMQEWGDVAECTDRVRELSEDPVIQEASKSLGEQATETTEGVIWGVLKAGSQVGYSYGTTRLGLSGGTAVGAITVNKIHAAVRVLNSQRAKFVTEIIGSSVNYDTRNVEAGYIAFAHTDLEHDIRALAGFIPVAKYGSRKPLCAYELGSVENVRFVLTVNAEPFLDATTALNTVFVGVTKNDVYPVVIIGRGAYAQVPLKGSKAVEMFVWTGGDKSDPLNQRDVVGAKYWFTAVRLNENWMYRLEVLATAL
jgi:N4-gp56 family major capsid protein